MQEMDYREEARNGLKFRLNSSSARQSPVQPIVHENTPSLRNI
jgi:predicted unusual protein kinase regulating ubiquinone biosynthesis (AarF/ABC1/UbiB family)